MAETWRPLSVRLSGSEEPYDALHDGVPPWLVESLSGWVRKQFQFTFRGRVQTSAEKLRKLERRMRRPLDWGGGFASYALGHLLTWARNQRERFLDAADFLLNELDPLNDKKEAESLEAILSEGGSAWRVSFHNERYSLERRVDETVQAVADKAMEGADPPARLLRDAWHSIYGREPNPSEAYRDAVRAVEAAAAPVIAPRDPKATLGKIISAMKDAPQKWCLGYRHPASSL